MSESRTTALVKTKLELKLLERQTNESSRNMTKSNALNKE